MNKIDRFKELMIEPDRKKADINKSINELMLEVQQLEEEILENEINDIDNNDLVLAANMLKSNLDREQKKADIVNSTDYKNKFVSAHNELNQLAQDIITDNTKGIDLLKAEYDLQIKDLLRAKDEYLKKVKYIGEIVSESNKLAGDITFVNKSIGNNTFCGGINTNYNDLRKTGDVFIQLSEVDKMYKSGH